MHENETATSAIRCNYEVNALTQPTHTHVEYNVSPIAMHVHLKSNIQFQQSLPTPCFQMSVAKYLYCWYIFLKIRRVFIQGTHCVHNVKLATCVNVSLYLFGELWDHCSCWKHYAWRHIEILGRATPSPPQLASKMSSYACFMVDCTLADQNKASNRSYNRVAPNIIPSCCT